MRRILTIVMTVTLLTSAGVTGAEEELTLNGELIEVSCYSKLGVDKGTGAGHLDCAKECAAKGLAVGILTDGDGLFKITGDWTANKNAKLLPYVGRKVELRGTRARYLDYSAAINVKTVTLSK